MPARPDAALLADPRFPKLCAKSMRKFGVPDFLEDQIRELVAGERKPNTLQCCHSGCSPCAQDILGCAGWILAEIDKPKKRFGLF